MTDNTVLPFRSRSRAKPAPSVWRCNCGCYDFLLHEAGDIECSGCGCFAHDMRGTWRVRTGIETEADKAADAARAASNTQEGIAMPNTPAERGPLRDVAQMSIQDLRRFAAVRTGMGGEGSDLHRLIDEIERLRSADARPETREDGEAHAAALRE